MRTELRSPSSSAATTNGAGVLVKSPRSTSRAEALEPDMQQVDDIIRQAHEMARSIRKEHHLPIPNQQEDGVIVESNSSVTETFFTSYTPPTFGESRDDNEGDSRGDTVRRVNHGNNDNRLEFQLHNYEDDIIEDLVKKNKTLERDNEALRVQAGSAILELQRQNQVLEAANVELRAQHDPLVSRIQELESAEKNSQSETSKKSSKSEPSDKNSQLEISNKKIQQANATIASLRKEIVSLEGENDQLREQYNSMVVEVQSLNQQKVTITQKAKVDKLKKKQNSSGGWMLNSFWSVDDSDNESIGFSSVLPQRVRITEDTTTMSTTTVTTTKQQRSIQMERSNSDGDGENNDDEMTSSTEDVINDLSRRNEELESEVEEYKKQLATFSPSPPITLASPERSGDNERNGHSSQNEEAIDATEQDESHVSSGSPSKPSSPNSSSNQNRTNKGLNVTFNDAAPDVKFFNRRQMRRINSDGNDPAAWMLQNMDSIKEEDAYDLFVGGLTEAAAKQPARVEKSILQRFAQQFGLMHDSDHGLEEMVEGLAKKTRALEQKNKSLKDVNENLKQKLRVDTLIGSPSDSAVGTAPPEQVFSHDCQSFDEMVENLMKRSKFLESENQKLESQNEELRLQETSIEMSDGEIVFSSTREDTGEDDDDASRDDMSDDAQSMDEDDAVSTDDMSDEARSMDEDVKRMEFQRVEDMKKLIVSLEEMSATIQFLEDQNNELQQRNDAVEELSEENEILRAEIESLRKRDVFSFDDMSTKNEKLQKLVEALEKLTKKTDNLEQTIVDLEGQLWKKDQLLRQQTDSADIVSSEYASLKSKYDETTSDNQTLQTKNEALEIDLTNLRQELDGLKIKSSTMDELKDELSFLKKHLAKLATENESLVQEREASTNHVRFVEEQKKIMEQVKLKHEEELARVRSHSNLQLDKVNEELACVQKSCMAQQKALEKMHTTSMEAMKQHLEATSAAQTQVACKEAEMEELKEQISRNTLKYQSMEKELEDKVFLLEKAGKDYANLLEKFVDTQRESNSFKNNSEASSTEAEAAFSALQTENKHLMEQVRELAEKENSEAGLKAKCEELSKELQHLKTTFAESRVSHTLEMKKATEEARNLRDQLEKAESADPSEHVDKQAALDELREQHKVALEEAALRIAELEAIKIQTEGELCSADASQLSQFKEQEKVLHVRIEELEREIEAQKLSMAQLDSDLRSQLLAEFDEEKISMELVNIAEQRRLREQYERSERQAVELAVSECKLHMADEIESLKEKLETLEGASANLTKDYDSKIDDQRKSYLKEVEELQSKISELQKASTSSVSHFDQENVIQELREENEMLSEQLGLTADLIRKSRALEEENEMLSEQQGLTADLIRKSRVLEEENEDLKRLRESLNESIIDEWLQEQNESYSDEVQALRIKLADFEMLSKNYNCTEAARLELEEQLSTQRLLTEDVTRKSSMLEKEVEQLRLMLPKPGESVEDLTKIIEENKMALNSKDDSIEGLTRENRMFSEEIQELKRQHITFDSLAKQRASIIESLSARAEGFEKENKSLKDSHAESLRQLRVKLEAAAEAEVAMQGAAAENELNLLKLGMKEKAAELEKLKNQIAVEAVESSKIRESEVAEIRAELTNELQWVRDAHEQTSRELQAVNDAEQVLQQKVADLTAQLQVSIGADEADALKAKICELEKHSENFTELLNLHSKQSKELDQLQIKCSRLQKENDKYKEQEMNDKGAIEVMIHDNVQDEEFQTLQELQQALKDSNLEEKRLQKELDIAIEKQAELESQLARRGMEDLESHLVVRENPSDEEEQRLRRELDEAKRSKSKLESEMALYRAEINASNERNAKEIERLRNELEHSRQEKHPNESRDMDHALRTELEEAKGRQAALEAQTREQQVNLEEANRRVLALSREIENYHDLQQRDPQEERRMVPYDKNNQASLLYSLQNQMEELRHELQRGQTGAASSAKAEMLTRDMIGTLCCLLLLFASSYF